MNTERADARGGSRLVAAADTVTPGWGGGYPARVERTGSVIMYRSRSSLRQPARGQRRDRQVTG